ncbi:uncharacterized protein LY89DRAFT_599771 [Mollisia scopiformis]|uniref:Uncharacterized protein n=1 Tax=Mollisia scopiformis TaxID=149040 RepID=A0A132B9A3_MOLSC|nr:uncharacterized protein LY89DRAFT_599771 [Mollisia scopiformis]KUJ08579.1 hypothetical protein LY89DRAFT_599771 [Mollisia scopiformis]
MLSLPSLAPQDSYTLWYTSSTSNDHTPFLESTDNDPSSQPRNQHPHSHRRHALHRTPLARLRHDEEYMERRKQNIQNYGSSWIKPPGVAKSLYQQREEDREMKEHQEALRREQLAQELADAEAEGAEEMLQGEGADGEMEEARDLDDDVPDADNTALEEDDSEDSDEENGTQEVRRDMVTARVPDDVYREAIVRGEDIAAGRFGGDGADDEDNSGMLQEEDLVHENAGHHDEDMDMDADIPEADEGGYEHTDTEAELSSSDDDSVDAGRLPSQFAASSMVRSDGTQNSMDLSSLISGGSSQIGGSSSPRQRVSLRGRGWRSSGNYPQ